ncbi:extracellular solute-binding protein [Devosia sp.]|jgi:iron(III) transport system substrate-binding protein|uniref:extracellular solute-binding protein n=1 Tax=Devosia sp. TaxID=1871048 RepID=UPI001ACB9995|nr:extracellular solute-binding protein [Devosia sp.]MBN9334862.1 extracellular solute-binding protein [Devosia sp.]
MALALAATTALSPALQAQEGPVVIYTAHKSSIVDRLLPVFESETGLKAEVVQLGSGDIARRARAEAGAPAADVIWSISGSQLTELADILEPYQPPEFDKIDTQFVANAAWTPYTAVVYVLAVNTDLLPLEEAPKSWAELADPKWQGLIASARADGSGSAMQQLQAVLTIFGDDGWNKYAEIAKNFVFTDSSGAVPRFVADGETQMGLTLEDNALEYVQGGAPVGVVLLSDGTVATPDGVGLVKGGPNPEGGKAFIDWALSKSTQELLATNIGRRSVRTDVAAPPGTPNLSDVNVISITPLSELGGAEAVLTQWRAAIGE